MHTTTIEINGRRIRIHHNADWSGEAYVNRYGVDTVSHTIPGWLAHDLMQSALGASHCCAGLPDINAMCVVAAARTWCARQRMYRDPDSGVRWSWVCKAADELESAITRLDSDAPSRRALGFQER